MTTISIKARCTKPSKPLVHEVVTYYPNGNTSRHYYQIVSNGLLHGEYKRWHFNGNLYECSIYDCGKIQKLMEYYQGGVPCAETIWEGRLVSKFTTFSDGKIQTERYFKLGNMISLRKWYKCGALKASGDFTYDGVSTRYNKYNRYYLNGQLQSAIDTLNGQKHGLFVECYDISKSDVTFTISIQGWYKNGQRDGLWQYWSKDGKCTGRYMFQNGLAI